MHPQQEQGVCKNSVFHMGELLIVSCALKDLGKLIDGSGLDQALAELVNDTGGSCQTFTLLSSKDL